MTDFTLPRFHNALRIMLNIDHDKIVGAGIEMDDAEWKTFQASPWKWFIRQDATTANKFWQLMIERGLMK